LKLYRKENRRKFQSTHLGIYQKGKNLGGKIFRGPLLGSRSYVIVR
jgi:hypothetical protein